MILSENAELRFISQDAAANGETDFKGETSTLSTDQRVEYLNEYARVFPMLHKDFSLDEPIVTIEAARERLRKIKPQPLPEKRRRIVLDEWKYTGHSENKKRETRGMRIEKQDFRCFMEWEIAADADTSAMQFSLGKAAVFGVDTDGGPYYITSKQRHSIFLDEGIRKIRMELDFIYRKWNLYLNDTLKVDFEDFSDTEVSEVSSFSSPFTPDVVSRIWGVGYHRLTENEFEPYSMRTFIDEDFKKPVIIDGWNTKEYNDAGWKTDVLPIVHGGERYDGEDLYLRRTFNIDEMPPIAQLYLENLTPGGEVYVNGRLAAFVEDEVCHKADITKYLKTGENLIAVRVYHDRVTEDTKMTHTSTDHCTGWFAGRMYIDLLPPIYIEDVYSYTKSIWDTKAEQAVEVSVKARRGLASKYIEPFTVTAKISKWFPTEGKVCARAEWQTSTAANLTERTTGTLNIEAPELWSADSPNLYKITVEIRDTKGVLWDDYVITTGIRTVTQRGGIFRINGKPELLRAPLLFGERPPLDKIAAWQKCPPAEYYVQEIMMLKGMNGNGFRMSVHDKRIGGMNDPRLCEIADQMGVMLIWQTTTWLRITSASNLDLDELKTCITQVRNAPSIVIWQPMNHPSWKSWDAAMKVLRLLYDAITSLDTTRLISPSADVRRMRARYDDGLTDFWGSPCEDCDPVWTAPLLCRGNMDYILGYGNEWSALREWPYVKEEHLPDWAESTGYIPSYLESRERAYFNFEHDETVGQPNWELYKGKPMYRIDSYEKDYDTGSIGRRLGHDEWPASQAWQALSAYETVKKCRMLDYDGLCWCNFRGGQNSGTYQKSLIDFYGQAKLAYYAHRMIFQSTVACSGNVDMVYGPDDAVPVIVLNIGEKRTVNVKAEVTDSNDTRVFEAEFRDVELAEGRTVTPAGEIKLPKLEEGLYCIKYILEEAH